MVTSIMSEYYFIGLFLNQECQAYSDVFVKGSLGRAKEIQDSYFYSDFFMSRSIVAVSKEEIDECRNDSHLWNQVSIEE
jgi:hypothetical protein